jgi:hypothetical protein
MESGYVVPTESVEEEQVSNREDMRWDPQLHHGVIFLH